VRHTVAYAVGLATPALAAIGLTGRPSDRKIGSGQANHIVPFGYALTFPEDDAFKINSGGSFHYIVKLASCVFVI
jgi:hypothetical protein